MEIEDLAYRIRNRKARKLAVGVAVAISVLGAAVWVYRDASFLANEFGPAEGSLIVNINTGTEEQLRSVPGIGPTRAAQIVAGRPYESVDDLDRIAGIGGKTLESLRPFLTVDEKTRKR
ncbi:MAG: helix-hairpin-helix domain-containing protein [Pseudomonadota bacterium]